MTAARIAAMIVVTAETTAGIAVVEARSPGLPVRTAGVGR